MGQQQGIGRDFHSFCHTGLQCVDHIRKVLIDQRFPGTNQRDLLDWLAELFQLRYDPFEAVVRNHGRYIGFVPNIFLFLLRAVIAVFALDIANVIGGDRDRKRRAQRDHFG